MQDLIQQKLEKVGWETLPHPPYSLDFTPSDYHLFRSLLNYLVTEHFDDQAKLKANFDGLFSSLSKKFFEDGFVNLPKGWEYIVDNNGIYVVD